MEHLFLKMYSQVLMTHVWPDSLKIKGATNRPIKHEFHDVGLCDKKKKRRSTLIMSKTFIVRTCPPTYKTTIYSIMLPISQHFEMR